MRKIDNKSIVCFLAASTPATAAAIYISSETINVLALSDSILVFKAILSVPMTLILNILALRIFLLFRPLKTGYYKEDSSEQFTYNIYVLFYLLFFNSLLPSLLIPIPLMRMIYIFLGAKLGENTYSAGSILDPSLVSVGDNTIIGFDSVLCPHAVESNQVYFAPIKVGHNVTIGMRSIVMAGVTIEDYCIVAAGSIVLKDSHLKKGEVWAGVPAKKIKIGIDKFMDTSLVTLKPRI